MKQFCKYMQLNQLQMLIIFDSKLFWNHVVECSRESYMSKDY